MKALRTICHYQIGAWGFIWVGFLRILQNFVISYSVGYELKFLNNRILSYFIKSESISLLIHSKHSLTRVLWGLQLQTSNHFPSLELLPLKSTLRQACNRLVVLVLMKSLTWHIAWIVDSKIPCRIVPHKKKNQDLFRKSLTQQFCLEQLTWPIMTLSKCVSYSNFRAFVSFSETLLLRMSAVEIDPQLFGFKNFQMSLWKCKS